MIQGKKWLPVIGLAILTVSLIFVFKEKDSGNFVKEQSSNLLNFYTKNLKSLFIGSPVSKEDVFNFALYEELPLDKENDQYLKLGDASGNEYFEFRKSPDAQRTRNLDEFARKLELNDAEREQMDSILESYSDQLRDKILVNDNNTIAINTNLWNLRKAVLADVMSFAANSNKDFAGLYEGFSQKNSPSVNEMIRNVRAAHDSNYIFITPDTIFTRHYTVDRTKMREELADLRQDMRKQRDQAVNLKINFDKENEKLNKQRVKGYKYHMDTDFVRIEVPQVDIPDIIIPDMEELLVNVEEFTRNMQKLKINITPPVPPVRKEKNKTGNNFEVPPDAPESFELNIDLPAIDSLVLQSLNGSNLLNPEYWEEFGRKMDSLGKKYDEAGEHFDKEKFQEEMKKLQKDLQKLKKKKQTTVEVK